MANYFENTPKYTIWTPKMVLKTTFWGFVAPYAMYKLFQPLYVRTLLPAIYPHQMLAR